MRRCPIGERWGFFLFPTSSSRSPPNPRACKHHPPTIHPGHWKPPMPRKASVNLMPRLSACRFPSQLLFSSPTFYLPHQGSRWLVIVPLRAVMLVMGLELERQCRALARSWRNCPTSTATACTFSPSIFILVFDNVVKISPSPRGEGEEKARGREGGG